MTMTLGEIDDRLVPAANLIETAPREALERLDDIVRREPFAPDDMWRVWECYSLIWYKLFDKQKSRAYAWQAITHPGGAPRIIQQIEYSDYLFFLHYFDDLSDDERRELEMLYDKFAQDAETFPHPLERHRHAKLRIGYIASAFADNVLSVFTAQLLIAYDRSAFEVYAYQLSETRDLYTDEVERQVEKLRMYPRNVDYRDVAQDIWNDEIDILFDLEVHSGGGRTMVVMCHRPAPVQVAGIGYMSSSGTKAVDYFLGDPYCDPPGLHEEDFAETILRMPHSHFCYTPSTRVLRAAHEYHVHSPIVFGSFNNFWKLTDHMLRLWLRIVRAVPGSHILIKNSSQKINAMRMTRRRLLHIGFRPGEFELEDVTAEYLSRYQDVDLLLDTYPYTGGGTTCDALYMGVPVVTRYGRRHGTRFSYSLLENIGLGELACRDDEEYVQKAVALARNPVLLSALHARIPEMMKASPVMDARAYLHDIQAAYQDIFARWRRGMEAGRQEMTRERRIYNIVDSIAKEQNIMGKANRRMNKRQQQRAQEMTRQETRDFRKELNDAYEKGQYADVINTMAELVGTKQQTPEDLYKCAYSYFMLGDYMRAAGMVTDVLAYDAAHVAARILLARICILEDRIDDGLAIFDFILEHYENALSEEQREDMEDILDYYGRTEQERIAKDFPSVAKFLSIEVEEDAEVAAPAPAASPAPKAAAPAAPAQAAPAAQPAAEDTAVAEQERQSVLAKTLPLKQKLHLLNMFAGAHFVAAEHASAAILLSAALDIDAADPETLRNLAVLAKCLGKHDQALALASKLPQTDFLLLDDLRTPTE
ncbi:MAG: hypothetical protein MR698_00265 [Selenomonas sp.]|nr:hypothetical protein [Selenomonas sp.]